MSLPYVRAKIISTGAAALLATDIPDATFIATTTAGVVRLILKGSYLDVPVEIGASILHGLSARSVDADHTTATCVVSALFET